MDYLDILRSLRQKEYQPVYFLHSTESYFIDVISDYLENEVLSESEKAFNLTVIYGKDAEPLSVLDAARRYPVMSERQVVLIKEAQEMKDLEELRAYIEKPLPSTILCICYRHKKLDSRTTFAKVLNQHAVVLETKPLYDNQVPGWIIQFGKEHELTIGPAEAGLIAEYLGADLSKVANELEKLALNVPKGATITRTHIEQYIGISREYNVFELNKALATRNLLKAFRMVQYFAANPKKGPMVLIIGSLYGFFSKVYMLHFLGGVPEKELVKQMQLKSAFPIRDFRLAARHFNRPQTEQVLALLREYDLKTKGVGASTTSVPEGELLKELVWRIVKGE